jgi:protein-S-isoprenylcysteine O-methyltransferase Ste14
MGIKSSRVAPFLFLSAFLIASGVRYVEAAELHPETLKTWQALCALQRPLPGPAPVLPEAVQFAGTVGFILCVYMFFLGLSLERIDGLLGVPGSVGAYSHGAETPLFTEGQYAQVRHPMYRAAILGGICGLLAHPNPAQLFWTLLIGATFVAFIPVEEAQMTAARGDD